MGLPFTVAHSSDFIMDSISIVKILQMLLHECLHNLFVFLQPQLIGQGKDNFLIPFSVTSLMTVCRLKELLGVSFCPARQMICRIEAAASFLENGFTVDVLHMAGCVNDIIAFLEVHHDVIYGFVYCSSSCP